MLRYGLVFLLVFFGSFKFFAFETEGIQPLLANSPIAGWLLSLLGVRGASDFFQPRTRYGQDRNIRAAARVLRANTLASWAVCLGTYLA